MCSAHLDNSESSDFTESFGFPDYFKCSDCVLCFESSKLGQSKDRNKNVAILREQHSLHSIFRTMEGEEGRDKTASMPTTEEFIIGEDNFCDIQKVGEEANKIRSQMIGEGGSSINIPITRIAASKTDPETEKEVNINTKTNKKEMRKKPSLFVDIPESRYVEGANTWSVEIPIIRTDSVPIKIHSEYEKKSVKSGEEEIPLKKTQNTSLAGDIKKAIETIKTDLSFRGMAAPKDGQTKDGQTNKQETVFSDIKPIPQLSLLIDSRGESFDSEVESSDEYIEATGPQAEETEDTGKPIEPLMSPLVSQIVEIRQFIQSFRGSLAAAAAEQGVYWAAPATVLLAHGMEELEKVPEEELEEEPEELEKVQEEELEKDDIKDKEEAKVGRTPAMGRQRSVSLASPGWAAHTPTFLQII